MTLNISDNAARPILVTSHSVRTSKYAPFFCNRSLSWTPPTHWIVLSISYVLHPCNVEEAFDRTGECSLSLFIHAYICLCTVLYLAMTNKTYESHYLKFISMTRNASIQITSEPVVYSTEHTILHTSCCDVIPYFVSYRNLTLSIFTIHSKTGKREGSSKDCAGATVDHVS